MPILKFELFAPSEKRAIEPSPLTVILLESVVSAVIPLEYTPIPLSPKTSISPALTKVPSLYTPADKLVEVFRNNSFPVEEFTP